jgi:hypothetical protein
MTSRSILASSRNAMLNQRVGRRTLVAKTTMDSFWSFLRAAWRGRWLSINCPAPGDEWLVLDTVNILEYTRGAELICDIGEGSRELKDSSIVRCIEFVLDHTRDGDNQDENRRTSARGRRFAALNRGRLKIRFSRAESFLRATCALTGATPSA